MRNETEIIYPLYLTYNFAKFLNFDTKSVAILFNFIFYDSVKVYRVLQLCNLNILDDTEIYYHNNIFHQTVNRLILCLIFYNKFYYLFLSLMKPYFLIKYYKIDTQEM